MDRQAVATPVERHGMLVFAGLGRHQPQFGCGDVRSVREKDVDSAAEGIRKRRVQITLVDVAGFADIDPGAPYLGRIDVRRMQLRVAQPGSHGNAERADLAAHVEHDVARSPEQRRLLHEELGPVPWHEDTGLDDEADPVELGPPDDLLEGLPGDASGDQGLELLRIVRLGEQQSRFLLGEDAPRGPKPQDDF